MTDFEVLQALLCDDAIQHSDGAKNLVLREPANQQQPEYCLKIRNVPNDIIAFRADTFPTPKGIFKNSKGECKRADFIVVARRREENWIIYIEMKRGKAESENEIKQQLLGAQCLVAYCRAIGQGFWQEPEFLREKNYQQRFICVRNIGAQKRQTRIPPESKRHDTPERMLKINAPSKNALEFGSLIRVP